MKEHNDGTRPDDRDIDADALEAHLRKAYPNRQFAEQETPTLMQGLIARLLIRDYRTGNDIVRMLDRTKTAVELYERDPEAPSPLSIVGVLTASMLLMDMLANEHLSDQYPAGFDLRPLRVLQTYVEHVLPDDCDL